MNSRNPHTAQQFYTEAYRSPSCTDDPASAHSQATYVLSAERAAEDNHIHEMVEAFVSRYHLEMASVLEIGSGRGYLQNVVKAYQGLDISPTAIRFYPNKNLTVGSATEIPFADSSFDAGWSIWVYEHVPDPETALEEIRRVMKHNAVFLLFPAWNCTTWAAGGYEVRPYADFGLKGRLIKASIPLRSLVPFKALTRIPRRLFRRAAATVVRPTRLHYRTLSPNYESFWVSDSDAVNAIDRYETMLWFRSRGDECLNTRGISGSVFMKADPLIVRIKKR